MTTRTIVKALADNSFTVRQAEALLRATRGCRPDMHEPEEQGVRARCGGRVFDNAGFDDREMQLVLVREGEPMAGASINMATLVALARLGAQQVIDEGGRK